MSNDKDSRNPIQKFLDLPDSEEDNLPPVPMKKDNPPAPTSTETQVAKVVDKFDYDDKDKEIEGMFDTIHDMALSKYNDIMDEMEDIDPKYHARNNEVGEKFLNTALQAIKERARIKQLKDRNATVVKTAPIKSTNIESQTVNINTTDLIKMLKKEEKDNNIIEGDFSSSDEKGK